MNSSSVPSPSASRSPERSSRPVTGMHVSDRGQLWSPEKVKTPERMQKSDFARMLYGQDNKRTSSSLNASKPRDNSYMSETAIQDAADAVLKGQALKVKGANAVADVIDEFHARRIACMDTGEYIKSKRLRDAAEMTRRQFRQNDRDGLYREGVAKVEARHNEAVAALDAAKDRWKVQRAEAAKIRTLTMEELATRHQSEHDALERQWTDPAMARKFAKRSPILLQQRQVEQYMLLSGDYEGAEQIKRIGANTEKMERLDREKEMKAAFEIARGTLVKRQKEEMAKLKLQQTSGSKFEQERERKDMEVRERRVVATKRALEEEKDYEHFIAKRYKHAAEVVVPATVLVTRENTEDLPALARGKAIPAWSSDLHRIRNKTIVTQLPLRPLAITSYKPPKEKKKVQKE